MSKWIKIAQHEDLDKKYEEYLKSEKSGKDDLFELRLELAEESLKRANSVLSGTKNINGMKVSFVDLPLQHNTRKPIQYTKIINDFERATVLADINGIRVPFYISTGQGGKENVAIGKWYTFFGHHEKGWMNKGQQDEMNSSYGSKKLAAIEDWLDTNLNFLKTHRENEFSPILPARVETKLSKIHRPLINRDMKPASTVKHDYDYSERAIELANMTPEQRNELYRKYNDDFNENVRQLIEKLDRATDPNNISSPADVLKNYIVSQCKGDAHEILLWSEGKSIVNNPPVEIRNIIMGMNPKITGLNHYIFNNVDAVNYFKIWIRNRTLGDEAFYYILDNNEEYLNLYRSWGRPNQIQNVEMHAKDENLENDPDIDRLKLKAQEEMNKPSMLKQSSKAIRKIRF